MPDNGDRARARRIIDRVRSYGVEVREMPGHETRGGTFVIVPVKVFDHHDASSRKAGEWGSLGLIMDGTPRGIPGPLANAQVARCLDGVPRIAWVADGTCSHGGLGSGLGLPTNAANPRTYGVEKANDGIGEPYTAAANYATNALFHAMAVECAADPATYTWGHKEWTPRKVDPLYSMADRRRQVGAFTAGDDMPTVGEVVNGVFEIELAPGVTLAKFIRANSPLDAKGSTVPINTQVLDIALDSQGTTLAKAATATETSTAAASQPVQLDAAAVATALASNRGFVDALAKAVNDDAARRLAS